MAEKFNVGDKVGFQFGSDYCIGRIVNFLTPVRVEIAVPEEFEDRIYEIDIFFLMKED